jgi:Ca-activated chloride channel homolog
MSFGSPLSLLALLVVPAVLAVPLLLARRRTRNPVVFTNLVVLEAVAPARRRRGRALVPVALLVLALATAAAATARPHASLPAEVDNATIVLLVDVSGSMSARDVEPTRLDAAVVAMRAFVQQLPKRFKVGLVQFSDTADVLLPPTDEHDRVTQAISLLEPQAGTALGSGLNRAVNLTQSSLARDGVFRTPGRPLPAAIVLLSDGKQTQGTMRPLVAAAHARAAGIRVDTVALGTPRGVLGYGPFAKPVPPDPALMFALAKTTGGRTATATDAEQLQAFYRGVGSSIGHVHRTQDVTAWFAAAAAVFLLGAVALGRAWAGALS